MSILLNHLVKKIPLEENLKFQFRHHRNEFLIDVKDLGEFEIYENRIIREILIGRELGIYYKVRKNEPENSLYFLGYNPTSPSLTHAAKFNLIKFFNNGLTFDSEKIPEEDYKKYFLSLNKVGNFLMMPKNYFLRKN